MACCITSQGIGFCAPSLWAVSSYQGFSPLCRGRVRVPRVRSTHCAARVTCVARSPWSADIEGMKDDKLYDLEEQLHSAINSEQYEEASAVKKEITRLQSAGFADVLTSFFTFYTSVNSKSVVDMARIFVQSDTVTCKHPLAREFCKEPGSEPTPLLFLQSSNCSMVTPAVALITGYIDVINSFGFIFAYDMPLITPVKPRISVRGSVAYVTCEEVMTPRLEPGTLRTHFQEEKQLLSYGAAEVRMTSIKIYVRSSGTTRLLPTLTLSLPFCYLHASHFSTSPSTYRHLTLSYA